MKFNAFISNRVISKDFKPVTCVHWNKSNGLIAYGHTNGNISISVVKANRNDPSSFKIGNSIVLSLHKASITSLSWNERLNKLISGDSSGQVIQWQEREGKWSPIYLRNNQINAGVRQILISPGCDSIAILYSDGIVYTSDFNFHSRVVKCPEVPQKIFWSSSGKSVCGCSEFGHFFKINKKDTDVTELNIPQQPGFSEFIFADWSRDVAEGNKLLVIYKDGEIHLFDDINNDPIVANSGLNVSSACWSNGYQMFAIGGSNGSGRSEIHIYDTKLRVIRTLNVSGFNIPSMSFNRANTQIIVAVDSSIVLCQLIPIYKWVFFQNTLVYCVNKYYTSKSDVFFFNYKTGEKHVKVLDNIVDICSSSNSVGIASKVSDTETAILVLDRRGIPLASNFVKINIKLVSKSDKYLVGASEKRVFIWDTDSDETFFISTGVEPTAICVEKTTLFIGFESGEVFTYSIPSLEQLGRYVVSSFVEKITVSSDMTRISVIDIFGGLHFIDIHSGNPTGRPHKETWDMHWADDSPNLFVSLEKQKLVVYHDFEATEIIPELKYICSFSKLEIVTVDFIQLYQNPSDPKTSSFKTIEVKLLRDVKALIKCIPDISSDEIVQHIKQKPHSVLWHLIGDAMMKEGKYNQAEKAFIECQNNQGLFFIDRIIQAQKDVIKHAYVNWYFGKYEDAEKCFDDGVNHELSIDMYSIKGDWKKVAEIASSSDKDFVYKAYSNYGDKLFADGRFADAAKAYIRGHNITSAINSYSYNGDSDSLVHLIEKLGSKSPYLELVGKALISLGRGRDAISAFLKCDNPQLAVASAIHLNLWNEAVKLTEKNKKRVSKKDLMGKYANYLAENGKVSKSIGLVIKFNLPESASKILEREGDYALLKKSYLLAKKCYVFSAIYKSKGTKDGNNELWHKAEALHFFLLAHSYIYSGNFDYGMTCAAAASKYQDFLGKERCAALTALAGFYSHNFKQCSDAFITLESSSLLSGVKQKKMKRLAVKIFGKNRPLDKESNIIKCPKCNKNSTSKLDFNCPCGFKPHLSIVSGSPVISTRWKCVRCNHSALAAEVKRMTVCPLCHMSKESSKK